MHAPPVGDETDPNGAKRLVSEAELSAEGGAHLEKTKKPKLSDAAQARYQQLLARLLEQEQARRKTIEEIRSISPSFNPTTFLRNPQGITTPTKSLGVDGSGEKSIHAEAGTRDLRLKRAQQKDMVTVFNRMVTSTTEDSELGIEKQKLLDFFQELTESLDASDQLSPSVFWKYTRGSKYKTETEHSKFYKTVHRWGIRTLHGVRWNNPTDENDARRIQEYCDQLATYGLVLDRAMVDTRLAMLIDEQKSTVSSKPQQLLAAKDKGVLVADASAAGPDDASSVSSAAGARVVAPASMHHVPMAGVADLNLRPDEERRFTQFFMAHMYDLWRKQQPNRGPG